jgi:DASS family divalent anion:Na+ symporter
MTQIYQCDVIICAMFITGQASNVLIAKFAAEVAGIELTYTRWLIAAIVPGLISLLLAPLILYRAFPPEIKHTPEAAAFAGDELRRMGPMSNGEKTMLIVFVLVAALWMTSGLHHINYAVVALFGICVLLLTGVLDWEDAISNAAPGTSSSGMEAW